MREGVAKLSEAIGNAEVVICATGFHPSFEILPLWKVDNFSMVNLIDACQSLQIFHVYNFYLMERGCVITVQH